MKYIFLTTSGYSFPIAKQLVDEGREVIVGQVKDPADLHVDGWQGKPEDPEETKRRLSLYDGMLEKLDGNYLMRRMRYIADAGKASDYFVVVDHNNLCRYGEKIAEMGFVGLVPNEADYQREKDREAAHAFVRANYRDVHIMESTSLSKADEGVALVNDSDCLWVLKSNGNLAETIVPKVADIELNHREIIGALEHDRKGYEKGGFLLEQKIANPVEFTPELAFWNGEPIYSQVEIECKPIGAGDVGADGGGAINLVVRTDLDDPINELCFPPIVYDMARNRRGLFIFDAGILYDPKSRQFYFTEFAGNRWSWGGVFSELAMSHQSGKTASRYFENVAAGRDPLTYKFGATVSLYNMSVDGKKAELHAEGMPVYWKEEIADRLYLYQVRKEKESFVNVGCSDILLGYATGYGNTMGACVRRAYETVSGISLKEMLYRHCHDYLSTDYPSAICNRLRFLVDGGYIKAPVPEKLAA